MDKPVATFADPERKVIDFYDAAGIATSVSEHFPSAVDSTGKVRAVQLAGTQRHIQVELEVGSSQDYPVTERAQMRVTCHAAPGQRTAVKQLASLAHGRILAWAGDEDVAGVSRGIGRSSVITDDATKNLMVWFTVRVDLKATQLAS